MVVQRFRLGRRIHREDIVEPTPELEKEDGDTQWHNGGSFRKVLLWLAFWSWDLIVVWDCCVF